MVREAIEKVKLVQHRLKSTEGREKSYADARRRELEFQIGE